MVYILSFFKQNLAERQGFEPWEGCPSTVFKTAAFDRSAISPTEILSYLLGGCNDFLQRILRTRKTDGNRYNGAHSSCDYRLRLVVL